MVLNVLLMFFYVGFGFGNSKQILINFTGCIKTLAIFGLGIMFCIKLELEF